VMNDKISSEKRDLGIFKLDLSMAITPSSNSAIR